MIEQIVVRKDLRLEVVKWLSNAKELGLSQGLTVMPKKVFYKYVPKSRSNGDGKIMRHLTRDELEKANSRLVHLINRLVLKNSYKRNGTKLVAVASIEGDGNSCIDLHTHFLLEKPESYTNEEFYEKVVKAIELSGEFEMSNPNYPPLSQKMSPAFNLVFLTLGADGVKQCHPTIISSKNKRCVV